MLADGYKDRKLKDKVFSTAKKAKEAAEKYGKENVINATIGSLYDENGKFVVLKTVADTYKELPLEEIANYASSFTGDDDYKKSVLISLFGDEYKNFLKGYYTSVIATPGGTGAISNTVKNYMNRGDKVLLPQWLWSPYTLMVKEKEGTPEYYDLFDKSGNITVSSLGNKIMKLSEVQDNLVIIINDPCQNPTGCRFEKEQWLELKEIINSASKKANIILILDIAYIDFDTRTEKEKKDILEIFKNFTSRVLTVFTFSISKSLTSYGLRVGAQIALSNSEEVIKEFSYANSFSCRSTWSNVSRGGMKLFSSIMLNKELQLKLKKEREYYRDILIKRAELFLKEAKESSLEVLPYKSGFFLTIPTYEYTSKVEYNLEKNNIFTVVLPEGIRIALCSVPSDKIMGLAKRIKNIIYESKNS